MKIEKVNNIISQWQKMTHTVLDLNTFSLKDMQALLKETYLVLTTYHKDSLIPKEISKLFLEIEDFLYFSSLMEEKERGLGYYHWQEIFHLIKSLEKGFFEGKYSCDYPKLIITDVLDNDLLIDLESDHLESYIIAFNELKSME